MKKRKPKTFSGSKALKRFSIDPVGYVRELTDRVERLEEMVYRLRRSDLANMAQMMKRRES
jgi:hypothetical protein